MNGSVEVQQIHSRELEGNALGSPADRPLVVYLPPGYAQGNERYPTVYFLHGFTGSALGWLNATPFAPNVPERLDALIAARKVPPAIGVFIDGFNEVGGTQWENSEAIGRYRDYVVRDVVGHIDSRLRTRPEAASRALVGKSSGGYGAVLLGGLHADLFAHIGSHAGDAYFEYCYLPDFPKAASALLKGGGVAPWHHDFLRRGRESKHRPDDHVVINTLGMAATYSPKSGEPLGLELPFELQTCALREDVWSKWLRHDPVRFIPSRMDSYRRLQSVFLDCGTRDEFNLRWGTRMVAAALRKGGVQAVHEEFEDGHMGINYRYDRSLGYLIPRMG
jgi:S-formylglutathione hydrolase FrmB